MPDPATATPQPVLPAPADAARLGGFLPDHPRWSIFWDKRRGVWHAAEDDPDSALYTESPDAEIRHR